MSLQLEGEIHSLTDEGPALWALCWTPEQNWPAPFDVALQGFNLKTLASVRWLHVECLHPGVRLVWRLPEMPTFNDISHHNRELVIARFRCEVPVRAGEKVRFRMTARPDPVAEASYPVRLQVQIPEVPAEGPVVFTTRAGPAISLRVIVRPAPETDGRLRVLLQPHDRYGYPAPFPAPVTVRLAWHGTDGPPVWEGELQETCLVWADPVSQPFSRLEAAWSATATPEDKPGREPVNRVTSNPIWRAEAGRMPVFGALHWHTDLSFDGMRSLDQAFTVARDMVNLDFAAPTDHTPQGAAWQKTVAACDRFDSPEQFTTLYSWEQSSDQGHVNFYFIDRDHPMNPDRFAYPVRPAAYIEDLPYADFLAIPHHTNAISYAVRDDGSHYWLTYPWGQPCPDYLRLVEIFQTRGNFEQEDPPAGWRHEFHGNGASVQSGLQKGHPLGFVGGTDNHQAWPAKENSQHRVNSWIYTGVWTSGRDRQSLFRALQARNTWACWDTRALVRFMVNGVLQGDTLWVTAGEPLTAHIRLSCEQRLDIVEIVGSDHRGRPVPTRHDALDWALQVDLGCARTDTYFYLRARQINGALIYASPVFVKIAAPADRSAVSP